MKMVEDISQQHLTAQDAALHSEMELRDGALKEELESRDRCMTAKLEEVWDKEECLL